MIGVRVLVICMAAAAVSACHRDSDAPVTATPISHIRVPPPVKRGPTAEELTVGMVEATTTGKSQLPVALKFDLPQRPAVGQALNINVAVIPQIAAGSGNIEVMGGDGLTVDPQSLHVDMSAVEAGQVYRQNVKVTPTTEGVLLLSLTVSLKRDESNESRAFFIPLIVDR